MTNRALSLCASASMAALLLSPAAARSDSTTKGTVDVIVVHGAALEGNLAGDPGSRRYPVVYLLHGFTDSDERWFGRVQHFINVPAVADDAIGAGLRGMIIVVTVWRTRSRSMRGIT